MPYVDHGIQGWMSDECLIWLYEQAQTMTSIVEVGSWKGRSTSALLQGCPGPVFAVDHFMGVPGKCHWTHHEVTTGGLFSEFWDNVGHFPNLTAMRMPSCEAAQYFSPESVDMAFIDGCHTYDSVMADLTAWRPKCRRLLCGHDAEFDSVQQALRDFGYRHHDDFNLGIWRMSDIRDSDN